MPNNPLLPADILNYYQWSAQNSINPPQLPAGYVLATHPTTTGILALRLFDAAYISTGIIDPNRLGTGATGAGNLYLADDGTWKAVGGGGGGGDMYKATYDVDNDGTVDSAERIEIIVRNSTGTTLTKGTVVYLSGATGNRPNAVKAQADTEATSSKTFGIVVADINNNSDGYVACNGTLHDLDTSAFADGTALWLSATTAGAYTSTIPAEPNHTVFIGYVARSHPTQGRLVILIQNGYELNELHGVLISSEANNDLLTYESSTGLWKNKTISTIFGGTPLVSVPTLDQVTTAGNTTTNAITVGGLTVGQVGGNGVINFPTSTSGFATSIYSTYAGNSLTFQIGSRTLQLNGGGQLNTNFNTTITGSTGSAALVVQQGNAAWSPVADFNGSAGTALRVNTNGNILIGTTTDAGYKLQVQGSGYFNTNTVSTNSILRLTDANNGTAWVGFSSITATGFFIGSNGGMTLGRVTADNSNPSSSHAQVIINQNGNANLQLTTNTANTGIVFSDGVNATIRMNFPSAGEAAITTISAHNLSIGVASSYGSLSSTTMKFFQSTGNVAINSTTDAGYKLDVNGTARIVNSLSVNNNVIVGSGVYTPTVVLSATNLYRTIQNDVGGLVIRTNSYGLQINDVGTGSLNNAFLTVSGSKTASSALAQGVYFNNTLVAAANNDVLVGLDIAPTFTNGAFTGVSNLAARIQGNTEISRTGADTQLTVARGGGASFTIQGKANSTSQSEGVNLYWTNNTWLKFVLGSSVVANFSNVGNLLVGTSTDSGYKLDVNGTARVSNTLRVVGSVGYGANVFEFGVNGGTGQNGYIDGYGRWFISNGGTNTRAATIGTNVLFLGQNLDSSAIQFSNPNNIIGQWSGTVGTFNNTSTSETIILVNNQETANLYGMTIAGDQTAGQLTSKNLLTLSHWGSSGVQTFGNTAAAQFYNLINVNIAVSPTQPNKTLRGFYYNPSISGTALAVHRAIETTSGDVIFNGGNVGIGTTSPFGKVDVKDGEIFVTTSTNANLRSRLTYQGLYVSRASDGTYPEQITSISSAWEYHTRNNHVFYRDGTAVLAVGQVGPSAYMTINTTGNVLIGTTTDAGYKLDVVGADSRFNGVRVGVGAGGIGSNTVVGNGALNANTSGYENTAIGYQSSYSLTGGLSNTAVGYQSLYLSTVGEANTAIGWYALRANTSDYITAVGYQALKSNTFGQSNTAVGANALEANTSGQNNTSVGWFSLQSNTTGSQNTALGSAALNVNSTGISNTAVGYIALEIVSTGSQNTAIGVQAGKSITTASNNTIIGSSALRNSTGSNNTAIGYQAGYYGVANTTGTNNIFIGNLATGVSATESNRTWIGNSSTTSTWLAGNVLIGTTTDAGYKLYVNGVIRSTSDVVAELSLKSNYQAGDEGGEITLNKPATGTVIDTSVTIDIYQNKLRIFESGGLNRGGYFDISGLSNGVGTNFSPTGYTGILNIMGNPPGQQNVHINNGIITSID